jgi:NAD(P)-dependent dehydrogenase (short-subunit alcohol dehydrogenase family)
LDFSSDGHNGYGPCGSSGLKSHVDGRGDRARPLRADDVANSVLFLASDEARFITTEILNVDGATDGTL